MKIETKRLLIIPLSYVQLENYLKPNRLEAEFNLLQNNRKVSSHLENKIFKILPLISRDKKINLYYTLWITVDKTLGLMVGDLCFKGKPVNGEIEIGYGTYEPFQNQGYMTEAVGAVVDWMFENTDIKSILAETAIENKYSQKILVSNKFVILKIGRHNIMWRRTKI